MRVLTAAAMRALDRATIDSGHATGSELMERAGAGLAERIGHRLGDPLALRVLVLCGPGNNGGDGFVAARHLAARGAKVQVVLCADAQSVRGDAAEAFARLGEQGLAAWVAPTPSDVATACRGDWDLVIDAMLGTGASGEPRGPIAAGCVVASRERSRGARVVAADMPTGVGADDGAAAAVAVRADLTVTFGALKRGHVLHPGRGLCGALEAIDIGLLPAEEAGVNGADFPLAADLATLVPRRDPRAHKGRAGRALLVGGSMGLTGAIALAARAACRAGCGVVRVGSPMSLADVLATKLTEPMVVACGETPARALSTASLSVLQAEATLADAVAVGPGLSREPGSLDVARALFAQVEKPLLLDADGLFAFVDRAERLAKAPAARVLTPHVGEMARLTGLDAAAVEARRIDLAAECAERWQCVVVLKGAPTVIASPGGRVTLNPTGGPALATAGTGDVLAGTIVALLAQGLPAHDAAVLGAWAHGRAGDLAAAEVGAIGAVAGDVVERLPKALSEAAAAG